VQGHRERVAAVPESLLDADGERGTHAELVEITLRWLPECLAHRGGGARKRKAEPTMAEVERMEAGIADRVFGLMDQVLRLGVTVDNPCYDRNAVTRRAVLVSRLFSLVDNASKEIADD